MNIAFYSNQLSERGTETALIDYASANEKYLHNKSFIAVPADKIESKERFEYLSQKYKIITFTTIDELKYALESNKIDLLYAIVDGYTQDIADQLDGCIPTFVHCVFSTQRKHGTYYCPIHQFLNSFYHTHYPVLPHIVNSFPECKENLRKQLGIPDSATVFGSYAGKGSFNIPFVQRTIIKTAENNNSIYFIFMNIYDFVSQLNHEKMNNIIFLPGSTDLVKKATFINTTDAMIHARIDGETFGLTVAEFSIMNKPVVTYRPNFLFRCKESIRSLLRKRPRYATAHIQNLGNKAILYKNERELQDILCHFDRYYNKQMQYDCFSEAFNAEKVIEIFNSIING